MPAEGGFRFVLCLISQAGESIPLALALAMGWLRQSHGNLYGAHTEQNIFLQTNGKAQRKQQLHVWSSCSEQYI